jgi:hypothetical protein
MSKRLGVVLVFMVLVAVISAWSAGAASERKISSFAFVVVQGAEDFKLKCESGCAWRELRHSCGTKTPCCARVDERGVRDVPCPAEE